MPILKSVSGKEDETPGEAANSVTVLQLAYTESRVPYLSVLSASCHLEQELATTAMYVHLLCLY